MTSTPIVRGKKHFASAADALFDVDDGATIMSGGFGLSGNAENCITAIATSGKRQLTIIANNCGNQRQGLAVLLQNKQVRRFVGSFVGGNPDLEELMLAGELDVELSPQGTFAERLRAGGHGRLRVPAPGRAAAPRPRRPQPVPRRTRRLQYAPDVLVHVANEQLVAVRLDDGLHA